MSFVGLFMLLALVMAAGLFGSLALMTILRLARTREPESPSRLEARVEQLEAQIEALQDQVAELLIESDDQRLHDPIDSPGERRAARRLRGE